MYRSVPRSKVGQSGAAELWGADEVILQQNDAKCIDIMDVSSHQNLVVSLGYDRTLVIVWWVVLISDA